MRSPAALPLALIAAFTLAHPAAAEKDKWSAWLDAGAFYNNHDDGRGEVTLWAPLDHTSDSVTFLDVRGKLFDAGELEGNLALGYREQRDGWNLWLWAGFDIRRSSLDSAFPQLSGGVEALSQDWDIRVNGYLPLDDSNVVSTSSVTVGGAPTILLDGNSILLQTGSSTTTSTLTELAFGGLDGEIGLRAPIELLDVNPKKLDLRLYGGGFHFDNGDAPKSISGPKARLELRINDVIDTLPGSRLTLEAEHTDDEVRGARSEFGLRLRVPLGDTAALASTAPQDARMTEGLRRDTDVVASAQSTLTTLGQVETEAVKDAATQVVLSKVAYVDGSTGISGIANAQGANTLIIAQGGNGNIAGTSVLQADQTLIGGGSTLHVTGVNSGIAAQFDAPGSRPTIEGQSLQKDGTALIVRPNNHVIGLDIIGENNGVGIALIPVISPILPVSNVVIEANTITGAQLGLETTSLASNVTIQNNIFTHPGIGISALNLSDSIIANNTLTVEDGIIIGSDVNTTYSNIEISSNTILAGTSLEAGIVLRAQGTGNQINIMNNVITAFDTFVVMSDGSTGTFSGNTLNAGNGGDVVRASGQNNSFTGAGNTSTNPGATLCSVTGNPGMNIQFVGGGSCP